MVEVHRDGNEKQAGKMLSEILSNNTLEKDIEGNRPSQPKYFYFFKAIPNYYYYF
jgi:hypothetical protein